MNLNETNPSILSQIKKALYDIFSESSSHGLSNIITSKKIYLKIMWTFFYITMWALFLFLLIRNLSNYYDYEVVTVISSYPSIPSLFPAVTLCNSIFNLINFNDYKYSNISSDIFQGNYSSNISFSEIKMGLQLSKFKLEEILWLLLNNESYNAENFYKENVISCSFDNHECNFNDFDIFYEYGLGVCLKYNGNYLKENFIPKKTSQVGGSSGAGLKIEFFLGNVSENPSDSGVGALLLIHDNYKKPSVNNAIKVSPGFESNYALTKTNEIKLKYPFNDCLDLNSINDYDSELYRITFEKFNKYEQTDCFDLCLEYSLINNCGCGQLDNPCLLLDDIICETKQYTRFFEKSIRDRCPGCPLECETNTYSYSSSFLGYPSDIYADLLLEYSNLKSKSLSKTNLSEQILSVNVYFNKLSYTNITQLAKTGPLDLVASVGGYLGLLLGVSFLTFVEGFQAFLTILLILCNMQKARSIKVVDPPDVIVLNKKNVRL